jgi:uracil-DNA glycosylase family 4
MNNKVLLEWQLAAGVDEATDNAPTNYFAIKPAAPVIYSPDSAATAPSSTKTAPESTTPTTPLHLSPNAAHNDARKLADNCKTIAELEEIVRNFDGCALKKTATKTVFSDGNPQAQIMIIGDAPNAQEDVQGVPFCDENGKLLDKMLMAIGLDRNSVYLTDIIFWRPPGNRQPSAEEIAICLPLIEKHIALVSPKLLILSGGTATNALLKKDQSIQRLRGKLYEYTNSYLNSPIKTALMYHPSYILRQPLHKNI